MYETNGEVVGALKAFADFYQPRATGSIISGQGRGPQFGGDPFRGGFIDSLDARTTLLKRLAVLDERDRNVVMLWYVNDVPVKDICTKLGVSRATLYRMRDRALQQMVECGAIREEASA